MSFDAILAPQPQLTLFSPLPASRMADGLLRMNERFVSGVTQHARNWPGPVVAVLRDADRGAQPPQSRLYDPDRLPFSVRLLPRETPLEQALEPQPGVVMAAANSREHLSLIDAARRMGLGVVLDVEHADETLQGGGVVGLCRRLWGLGASLHQERRRCRALCRADGVQLNGYPVSHEYLGLNGNAIRLLDSRIGRDMLASNADMARRRESLAQGGPLRLVHAGGLDRRQGAQWLIALAGALRGSGLAFSLAVEGAGPLEPVMRRQIARLGLQDCVHLTGPMDFAEGLVPLLRERADLLISCRTGDAPANVFLEAMGCGLPVLGFDNAMLAPLIRDSAGGWTVPQRDIAAMAARIIGLDRDRDLISACARSALDHARRHDFETVFHKRAAHLRQVFLKTHAERFVPDEWLARRGRAGS